MRMNHEQAVGIVKKDSPWDILGIPMNASWDVVLKGYRHAVMKAHPDAGGSHEAFLRVSAAFTILKRRWGKA
jgi:curved DNA-binding protein CbpA